MNEVLGVIQAFRLRSGFTLYQKCRSSGLPQDWAPTCHAPRAGVEPTINQAGIAPHENGLVTGYTGGQVGGLALFR